ncbi:MAG: iron-containing alcohol dehydrogenase [Lachnospiraceae bacterium]|nr:iron-containing alcohol dehydrogenase [Lachnospiraceae bacterium]
MRFYMPGRLIVGENAVRTNAALLKTYGLRCLIVTGGSSAKKSGALADVTEALKEQGIAFELFDGIEQNPSVASCLRAGRMAAAFGAQFILGIGGGSPMDASKTIAVVTANPELTEEKLYAYEWKENPLPIVLVGTTAGTGSEVTKISVLTDSSGKKHSIKADTMYASLAFGDPRYTMTLPPRFTLSTGLDALAHCVESYFSKMGDDISRGFAAAGIRILMKELPAVKAGDVLSLSQREQLYHASILGGLAINTSGTIFPHSVGYLLTEEYHVPHGIASACFMPDLLDFTAAGDPQLAEAFYAHIGAEKEAFTAWVEGLLPGLDVVMSEEQIDAALPRWDNNAQRLNTAGNLTLADIRGILVRKFVP